MRYSAETASADSFSVIPDFIIRHLQKQKENLPLIESTGRARKESRRTQFAISSTELNLYPGTQKDQIFRSGLSAPQVGLEPTTLRLTAECSAIELLRNIGIRRRPTLPDRYQSSTIGTEGLNFCVRYGNRWDPFVIATGNGELCLETVFIPVLRFRFSRPSDLPFLPPSGLRCFHTLTTAQLSLIQFL